VITDESLRTADDRVQSVIDSMYARIMSGQRFAFAKARRSLGQRLRRRSAAQLDYLAHEWAISTGAPK
jgi:hypothetical protein